MAKKFSELRQALHDQVIGQADAIDELLVALLADGHVLLEGAPGLAKTRIARLIAQSFDGAFSRIQFTPDLMPADLTGSMIYSQKEEQFSFHKGPLFSDFLLADEINRAPAKVQSALLEAMEERQVTIADHSHALGQTFFVIATQNPVEHEGTWELPQAQLDRFLVHVRVDYPTVEFEQAILDLALREADEAAQGGGKRTVATMQLSELAAARAEVLKIHLSPLIKSYLTRLVAATRSSSESIEGVQEHLAHPVSPRGSIGLARTAQARAWLSARDHVLPEDVTAMAHAVLRHRMGLTYRAEAMNVSSDTIVSAILDRVDVG